MYHVSGPQYFKVYVPTPLQAGCIYNHSYLTSHMCSMSIGVSVGRRRVVHKVHTSVSTAFEQVVSIINTTNKQYH